jgi:tRNA(Ile)-lysidine synthase
MHVSENVCRFVPPAAGPLVIAVSGGVDSVLLLNRLAKDGRWPLVVAHFDHGLRAESAEDAEFVRRLAQNAGITVFVRRGDVLGHREKMRQTVEEAARDLRHAFLREIREEVGAVAIVTGHHADDRAETLMLNLFRGAGAKGLGAMRMWNSKARILRPLLPYRKSEIVNAATADGLKWCEDATNADLDYDRNWVRNALFPALEQRRSGVVGVLARSAEHFAMVSDFIAHQGRDWIRTAEAECRFRSRGALFDRSAFASLHPVLQGEVLLQVWSRAHGSREGFSQKRVSEIVTWLEKGRDGTELFFGQGVVLRLHGSEVCLGQPRPRVRSAPPTPTNPAPAAS